jgi:hypothetical protein
MTLADLKAPQVLGLITDASCEEVPGEILAGWLVDDSSSKESTCCSGNIMLLIMIMRYDHACNSRHRPSPAAIVTAAVP